MNMQMKKRRSHLVAVITELDAAYDHDGQCYRAGKNDDSIAKIVGVSPVFVGKVRGEHFGPAEKPKPKTEADRIAAMEKTVAELSASVAALMDAATKPASRAQKSSRAEIDKAILSALGSGNWMDTASLARIAKARNTTVVSAQLGRMRSKGLVESKPNTFSNMGKVTLLWRRVQE